VRCLLLCQKFTAKSASERILKTGQHFAKLEARVGWHLFLDMVYINAIVVFIILHYYNTTVLQVNCEWQVTFVVYIRD